MTTRILKVSGLPADVEVRASARRRKTVTAFREGGTTVVIVPERMPLAGVRVAVMNLLTRLERSEPRTPMGDYELTQRAEALRQRYVPEAPPVARITWSSRQRKRWGSCTPADRTIRISDMLVGMPGYVLDSVLIHELAHLVAAHHGPAFQELIARFEQQKAADAFLAGYDFARSTVPGVGGQAPSPDLADRQESACQVAR